MALINRHWESTRTLPTLTDLRSYGFSKSNLVLILWKHEPRSWSQQKIRISFKRSTLTVSQNHDSDSRKESKNRRVYKNQNQFWIFNLSESTEWDKSNIYVLSWTDLSPPSTLSYVSISWKHIPLSLLLTEFNPLRMNRRYLKSKCRGNITYCGIGI